MVTCEFHEVQSPSRGDKVEVSALLPDGYDPKGEPYPQIIQLHGGGSNRHHLSTLAPLYHQMFEDGTLQPCVVVSLTSGVSMYIGFEEFVAHELPAWAAKQYNCRSDRDALCMTGASMGGFGTLHIGLQFPEYFCAIAAMEPAIEPGFEPGPPDSRNSWWRSDTSLVSDVSDGEGMDLNFVNKSPAKMIRDDAEAIRSSGMEIYLEAGDEDYTNLHDGTEFLHRVLWDNDIRHDYHLVRWADHIGSSMLWRTVEAHRFLAGALSGGRSEKRDLEIPDGIMEKLVGIVTDPDYVHTAPDDTSLVDIFNSEYGPTAHARMYDEMRATAAGDPDLKRNYAKMPPTS